MFLPPNALIKLSSPSTKPIQVPTTLRGTTDTNVANAAATIGNTVSAALILNAIGGGLGGYIGWKRNKSYLSSALWGLGLGVIPSAIVLLAGAASASSQIGT